jgi:hypothetical protein
MLAPSSCRVRELLSSLHAVAGLEPSDTVNIHEKDVIVRSDRWLFGSLLLLMCC